jgi:hypothetical protein
MFFLYHDEAVNSMDTRRLAAFFILYMFTCSCRIELFIDLRKSACPVTVLVAL